MVAINWNMLGPQVDYVGQAQAGFQQGRALRRQLETDSALKGVAAGDPGAIQRVAAWDPQLAASLENQAFQRGERARVSEGRSALTDVLLAGQPQRQPNALAGAGQPRVLPDGNLPPPQQTAGTQMRSRGSGPSPEPQTNVTLADVENASAPQSVLSAFAPQPVNLLPPAMTEPQPTRSPRAAAFERLAKADPETAYKVQKMDAEQKTALAETLGKQMDIGGRVMGAVLQAPSEQQAAVYQQLRTELEGAGVIDLPDEWDLVAAQARMRMGMTVLQAVGADRQDRKLDWDIRDDELDNERADENTESQINYRGEQVRLGGERISTTRRGQDLTDTRGRRGQDVASGDRRRGQDLSDARGRRGQDMTDRRGRESASFSGAGRKPGRAGAGSSSARIINPQTGRAAILKNGAWVDEQTGKPLS
jgi:hypothetical protein